jgi:hypothetical protein
MTPTLEDLREHANDGRSAWFVYGDNEPRELKSGFDFLAAMRDSRNLNLENVRLTKLAALELLVERLSDLQSEALQKVIELNQAILATARDIVAERELARERAELEGK